MKLARIASGAAAFNPTKVAVDNVDDNRNDNNNNNSSANISSREIQTISLGIHSELTQLRAALMQSTLEKTSAAAAASPAPKSPPPLPPPLPKYVALDIARQITNLDPEPLFVTVGYNGSDMCVYTRPRSTTPVA